MKCDKCGQDGALVAISRERANRETHFCCKGCTNHNTHFIEAMPYAAAREMARREAEVRALYGPQHVEDIKSGRKTCQ